MSVSADGAYITSTADGENIAFAIADGAITTTTTHLPIADIRINGGTQSRVYLHEPTVAEYAEVVRAGGQLPPVVVFDDGVELWLADGFHRYHGHRAAGVDYILCEVHFGTRRDAILYSVGANAAHGLRRTNDDKRRAVQTLLADEEWSTWTQSKIASACGVSREFVSRLSSELPASCDRSQDSKRIVERNGVTYEQNTANIGKAKPVAAPASDIAAAPTAPPAPAAVPPPVEVEHEHVEPSDEEVAAALKADADQAQYIRDLLERTDDPLTIALADVDTMRRMNAVLESRLAGLQNTVNEQIRVINSQRKKLEKLERAS